MKKLLIASTLFLVSCSETNQKAIKEKTQVTDSIIPLDSLQVDSMAEKITNLLLTTEHADKKVREIKTIKQENMSLKKELIETKAELEEVKAVLADTTSEVKKKKTHQSRIMVKLKFVKLM
jgi:septal ring factor EnvC (AmiA/AmiB activator)